MSHRVLETDFPLMAPPNPPSLVQRQRSRDRGAEPSPSSAAAPTPPPAYNRHSTSLGRTGSLRKAYSESSSADEDGGRGPAETEPLYPRHGAGQGRRTTSSTGVNVVPGDAINGRPSPQRSQLSSATSDYHSEQQIILAQQHLGKPIKDNLKKPRRCGRLIDPTILWGLTNLQDLA